MLWAACCLGFFGFMRVGEFTIVSSTKDTLSVADVSIDSRDNPQMLAVYLPHQDRSVCCRSPPVCGSDGQLTHMGG